MKNLSQMMKQAQEMQERMQAMQERLAEEEVTGASGGGMVTVTLTGKGGLRKLKIDPSLVDPDDVEMLEDLVLAALHDAVSKVLDAQAAANPLAGMGGLGGLLGQG